MAFKVKGLLATICINIFALLAVDVMSEINRYQETIQRLDYTIDTSVDLAVMNTLASEEFFSEEYQSKFSSLSRAGDSANRGSSAEEDILTANLKVLRNGWVDGNSYVMAMYYSEYGKFPESQSEYNSYANLKGKPEDIYEFMFGTVGSDKYDPNIAWSLPFNDRTGVVTASTTRVPTADFLDFYENVGKNIVSEQFVKVKSGNTWVSAIVELPVLTQMGLRLDPVVNDPMTCSYTGNNYVSVEHEGKLIAGSGTERTAYYLTPYSLGVTYLHPDVLKYNCLANIENLVRFSKSKEMGRGISAELSSTGIYATYKSADGCIDTSYYVDDAGDVQSDSVDHDHSNWIINDGEVEYDLDTLEIKVDYFTVDFYDDSNYRVVNEIMGSVPYDADLTDLPSKLEALDTQSGTSYYNGDRIVARVSMRVKLHIPFKSAIMQWYINQTSNNTNEHYDVAQFDDSTGQLMVDADGVWYQYHTYAAITE